MYWILPVPVVLAGSAVALCSLLATAHLCPSMRIEGYVALELPLLADSIGCVHSRQLPLSKNLRRKPLRNSGQALVFPFDELLATMARSHGVRGCRPRLHGCRKKCGAKKNSKTRSGLTPFENTKLRIKKIFPIPNKNHQHTAFILEGIFSIYYIALE